MFGYINVNRKELSPEDEHIYQGYYCGLCQKLKELAGPKAQMLLNYDMAFLIVLLSGLYELDHEEKDLRCMLHPLSKKWTDVNEATEYAAAMDIVLSYYNLKDDARDKDNALYEWISNLYREQIENIKDQYPRQIRAIEDYIKRLSEAENTRETNLDKVSGYTGEMLGEVLQWKKDEWSKDLYQMGYYLGKFIYILDAYEDLAKDVKHGDYNPLFYVQLDGDEYESYIKTTLNTMMAECAKAFERMPILQHASIIRNIIYSGVWNKYEYLQLKRK